MAFALIAAAIHGCFVALGFVATFTILAAAIFLAFFHFGFHVFAGATGLSVFGFAFVLVGVLAATGHGVFGVGCGLMTTAFAIFHVGHVVMAAARGFRGG